MKQKMNRYLKYIIVGISVIFIVLFILFASIKILFALLPSNHLIIANDTEDWQIYKNETGGYSIKYPKHWEVGQDQTPAGEIVGIHAKEILSMPDDYKGMSIVV